MSCSVCAVLIMPLDRSVGQADDRHGDRGDHGGLGAAGAVAALKVGRAASASYCLVEGVSESYKEA
jgi:hypothetical protein